MHDNGSRHVGVIGADIVVGASFRKLEREGRAHRHIAAIKDSAVGDGVRDAALVRPDDG